MLMGIHLPHESIRALHSINSLFICFPSCIYCALIVYFVRLDGYSIGARREEEECDVLLNTHRERLYSYYMHRSIRQEIINSSSSTPLILSTQISPQINFIIYMKSLDQWILHYLIQSKNSQLSSKRQTTFVSFESFKLFPKPMWYCFHDDRTRQLIYAIIYLFKSLNYYTIHALVTRIARWEVLVCDTTRCFLDSRTIK